jgi:uncharacterized membrane protein YheB (UPF0754 family)
VDLVCNLDHEERLVHVFEDLAVHVFEVLRDVDLSAVVQEDVLQWARSEIDVLHEIAAAISPVSDDGFATELELGDLLGLMRAL